MTRLHIPADHPTLAGHFPGNPVVPGVVILDQVLQALSDKLNKPVTLVAVNNIKFISPLLPEQVFDIVLTPKREDDMQCWTFSCQHEDRLLAKGELSLS